MSHLTHSLIPKVNFNKKFDSIADVWWQLSTTPLTSPLASYLGKWLRKLHALLLCIDRSNHSTRANMETLIPRHKHNKTHTSISFPFSQAIFLTCLGLWPSVPRKPHYGSNKSLHTFLVHVWHHPKSNLRDYICGVTIKRTYIKLFFFYNFLYLFFFFFCQPGFLNHFFVLFNFDFW